MTYSVQSGVIGCCGVMEWFDFTDEEDPFGVDAQAESFDELLKAMRRSGEGFMNHIHFVKRRGYDNYEWNELRDLVSQIPGVIHMGEFKNPNTGNMIDSYCWNDPN